MHILHSGYGIGSFIIPLIANPFLAVPETNEQHTISDNISFSFGAKNNFSYIVNTSTPSSEKYSRYSRIEYAYLIPAILTICMSLGFYWYQYNTTRRPFKGKRKLTDENTPAKNAASHSMKFKEMLNPATCTEGRFVYGLQVFIFLFLFYFNCTGGERICGTFIRAFAIDYFGFSVDEGSYINTSFWISFSVGRFVGFLAARWISIRILILIEASGVLISAICMVLFGAGSSMALWVLIQPIGFFTGPLYPSGMGWANYHVCMTGFGITVLIFGESFGTLAYLKLLGYLYDTYGPKTYLYTLVGNGAAMLIVVIVLDVIGFRHGGRFVNTSVQTEEPANDILIVDGTKQHDTTI